MPLPPQPDGSSPAQGYTLPLVLVLVLVVAAFCASALDEAVTNRTLSAARLAQQRAFLAATSGLNSATAELQRTPDLTGPLELPMNAPDHVRVEVRRTLRNTLPPGFSSGHFAEQFYELHSTGRSVRGARSLQVQGLRRVEPMDAPRAREAAP